MPLMLHVLGPRLPCKRFSNRRTIIQRAETIMSESEGYIVREY